VIFINPIMRMKVLHTTCIPVTYKSLYFRFP
jgi:hypothetical protein